MATVSLQIRCMVCLLCVSCSSAISSTLDLSLRTLEGDHIRPMAQALVDLPPEVANVANQAAATGGILLGRCMLLEWGV